MSDVPANRIEDYAIIGNYESAALAGRDGSIDWLGRSIRDAIHAQVCDRGYDPVQNSFIQSYGSTALNASLLLIPMVGFLPPADPRIRDTLAAIERNLIRDGLVLRYHSPEGTVLESVRPSRAYIRGEAYAKNSRYHRCECWGGPRHGS